MKRNKADIVMLQEAHGTRETNKLWCAEWGGQVVFANGASNAKGVVILFSKKFSLSTEIIVTFFADVFRHIDSLECDFMIIGGDFNLTLDEKLDRSRHTSYHPESTGYILQQIEELDLIDVWRHRNPDTKKFTWSKFDRKSHTLSWSRIDMFLIPSCLMNKVSKCEILPGYASDQSIITLELNLGEQKRGPGYWKLNNMLLQDEKYVNIINEGIDKTLGMFEHLDPPRKWELLKFKLADISKEYAQFKRDKEKWKRFDLYHLLGNMQDELVTSPSLELANNISLVRNEISAYEMLDTKRVMFHFKQRWHQLGERSSRYYFNMEKHNYISKTMYEVRKNNGELTKDYHEILN